MATKNSKFDKQAEIIYLQKFSNSRYRLFSLIEKIYKKFINNRDPRLQVILQAIKQSRPKNILEIGSGTFPIYAHLTKKLKQTVNYRICEVNVQKTKYLAKKYKGIKISSSDALNLPYQDNSFDFVFSKGVLHHVDDENIEKTKQKRIKFLIESKRILKNNGVNLLMDFEYDAKKLKDVFWHNLHKIILLEGEHNFSEKKEVVDWFNLTGYRQIKAGKFDTFKGSYYYIISKK